MANLCRLKRLATILLIGILFFNWYGYQLLSGFLEGKADQQLQARLDRSQFDETQLISIKIPITSLSYYNSSANFERVDGQIDIGGVPYRYVKRRLFKDSLELICIADQPAISLHAAKEDFFRQVNDLQQQANPAKKIPVPGTSGKNFGKDICTCSPDLFTSYPQRILLVINIPHGKVQLPSRYLPTGERPPDPILS